ESPDGRKRVRLHLPRAAGFPQALLQGPAARGARPPDPHDFATRGTKDMSRSLTVTWEDPIAAFEQGRKFSRAIDYLRAIRDGNRPAPPIAKLLSMDLVEVEEGSAVFQLTPAEQHYNPIGVVHGGIALTMLDSAMSCAVQTMLPEGKG